MREFGLGSMAQPVTQIRPKAVGPDQGRGLPLYRLPAVRSDDRDIVAADGKILDLASQLQRNIRTFLDRRTQRRLQIAAMDQPERRAVALLGGGAQRGACKHPSGGGV